MSSSNCVISAKLFIDVMIKRINDPLENINGMQFLEQLDSIMSEEITEEDTNLIKNFFRSGYCKQIINRTQENEKLALEKKVEELEAKVKKLENEKYVISFELEELKKNNKDLGIKVVSLENSQKGYVLKNSKLEEKINSLEKDKNDFVLKNSQLEEKNSQLELKNSRLEQRVKDLGNKLKKQENTLNNLMNDYYNKNQSELNNKPILNKIKERDNYKSLIFAILINAGASFEEINKNIMKTYKKYCNNINEYMDELFCEAKIYLKEGNDAAHDSTKKDIFKLLFPGYFVDFGSFFKDSTLNDIKTIISMINENEKKDESEKKSIEIKKRIDDITLRIRKEFDN